MKKIISALLAASLLIPGAAFADGGMEEILVSVKDKVSVPDNLTEFNTDYSTDENGITTYYFSWTANDGDGTFDVEDLAMGLIRFDNGAVLQIEFSWASNVERETRFVELRGTKSGLTWEGDSGVTFYSDGDSYGRDFSLRAVVSLRSEIPAGV